MWLDNLIGFFSPSRGYKRLQYRQAQEIISSRKYEGAANTRRTRGWHTQSLSANAENATSIEILRNRSRDLIRNNPYAKKAQQMVSTNVVGKGIMANIQSPTDALRQRHQALWMRWAGTDAIDYDCKMNFYAMQALIMKSVFESGEVLIRRRRVRSSDGPVPIKLQILEADHLATNRIWRNSSNGNRIVQGIEIDERDCVVAYHLYENHPGNVGVDAIDIKTPFKIMRVPADDILHVYRIDRPGQLRGVPWLHSAIIRMRELDEYEDAMLVKQKVSACFSAFVHDIEPPPTISTTSDGYELEKLEPGIVEYLPPGKDIKFGTPPLPNGEAQKVFLSTVLHSIAAGIGITYEGLTSDLSEVNFSSARMGWLEFSRNIDSWRAHTLDPMFNDKVWQWFSEAAELSGENMSDSFVQWTAPRREMIDPTKEVPAKIKAVRAGIETLSDVVRQTGKHPSQHFSEIKQDNDILDQLGLILDSDPRNTNTTGTAQDTSEQ